MKKLLRITFILICAVRRLHRQGCWGRQRSVVCLLLSAVVIAVSALSASPIPLSTTTEITSTAIARFRAYHGETVRLTHRLTLAGAPLDLSGASARFYWRTEEMEDWWSTDATLEADSVWCDFTPEMDPGTEAIWYFFGITQEQSIAYRANGSLTLLDSPGFTPADLGEPDALAAALEALFKEADTRYTTKEQLTSLEEGLTAEAAERESADQQLHQALAVESTQRTAQLNALTNTLATKAEQSHTHTISQVSGLQTQLNNMTNTLNNKASKSEFNSDDINLPYVKAYGASMHSLRTVFNANNEADNWAEKFDNAKLTFEWWHQYDNVKEDSFDVPMTAFRALAAGGSGSSPTPTLEVATWSGSVCSVPWSANPLLIDCTGQTERDFTIQFPVADWPEGAARLLFIRATPTPTVGDGIIDSVKGGDGLLTPSVVGYDYLEQGEEHTVSAWRRGARLRLMVVDRERLSDL